MVRIRLRRVGARNQPSYRIVAADKESPRDGRFLENLGHYNPRTEPSTVAIDESRLFHWLKNGAQPSDAVVQLLRAHGTWDRWERYKQGEDLEDLLAEAEESFVKADPRTRRDDLQGVQREKKAEAAQEVEEEAAAPKPSSEAPEPPAEDEPEAEAQEIPAGEEGEGEPEAAEKEAEGKVADSTEVHAETDVEGDSPEGADEGEGEQEGEDEPEGELSGDSEEGAGEETEDQTSDKSEEEEEEK